MNKIFRITAAIVIFVWITIQTFSPLSIPIARAVAPTPTPKPSAIFSPKNYNKNRPSGIQAVLQWLLGGGGGPLMLCDEAPQPTVQFEKLNTRKASDTFELGEVVIILGCNWTADEQLSLTIRYPNGKTVNASMPALGLGNNWGGIYYNFRPGLTDPPGKYNVTIQGNSATATKSVSFVKPTGTEVFWLGNNTLYLQGFSPSEVVQVVAYDNNNQFQGWQEYQVSRDGSLALQIDLPAGFFVLVSSAQRPIDLAMEIPPSGIEKAEETCQRVLPSRLIPQTWATALNKITYYTLPTTTAKVIRTMQAQSRHLALEGPFCAEGKRWWRMESKKGFSGFVIEADNKNYYLQPVPQ